MDKFVKIHSFKDGRVMHEDRIAYANGEYVSWTDHQKAVNELCNEIARLESELSKTKELLQEKYKGDIFTGCECGGYHLAKEKIKELETELESKEKLHKINLNDPIKVKLTPYGAEIYYHQFDDINKRYGRQVFEPHLPTIDKDGYTKFLLHGFMELYGEYMYAGARNVIEPIEIIACD